MNGRFCLMSGSDAILRFQLVFFRAFRSGAARRAVFRLGRREAFLFLVFAMLFLLLALRAGRRGAEWLLFLAGVLARFLVGVAAFDDFFRFGADRFRFFAAAFAFFRAATACITPPCFLTIFCQSDSLRRLAVRRFFMGFSRRPTMVFLPFYSALRDL